MERRKLTRRELYDLVWSMPMTKLARQFGMSDVALRKRCHNHEIPTPGVGYWALVAAGHKPDKEELPPAAPELEYVSFDRHPTSPTEKPAVPVINVAAELRDPHPAVQWLDKALDKAKPDQLGRRRVGGTYYPEALITDSSRGRALHVLDALFKALQGRGHQVEARLRRRHSTENEMLVSAFEAELSIHVEEKLSRKVHVLTAAERKEKERWEKQGWGGWNRAPQYDYFAEGELKVSIGLTHHKYAGRKSYSDTKTQRLDELLGQLVLTIEAAARLARTEQLEEERLQRERRDAERKRLRGKRLRWYGTKLAEEVNEAAALWRKAAKLRQFLAAYDRAAPAAQRNDIAEAWFNAVSSYVEQLDPLTKPEVLPKELEPSDEALEELIAAEKARSQR